MQPVARWFVELTAMLGLKAAGHVFPPLKAPIATATAAYTILYKIDDAMQMQAVEDVKRANNITDRHSLVLCEGPNGTRFDGSQGKIFLEQVVKTMGGGTAWYQSGHGRMECFWINDKDFKPRPSGRYDGVGYVVHGHRNP